MTSETHSVTVLCCETVPMHESGLRLDLEALRQLMRGYEDITSTCVSRQGGYIVDRTADEIIAFFGFPLDQEREIERAIQAGMELVKSLAEWSARHDLESLRVRMGIDFCPVRFRIGQTDTAEEIDLTDTATSHPLRPFDELVTRLGYSPDKAITRSRKIRPLLDGLLGLNKERLDRTRFQSWLKPGQRLNVSRATIALAYRLMPLAPPGGICVSEAVRGMSNHAFQFTDLGELHLKGFRARPALVVRANRVEEALESARNNSRMCSAQIANVEEFRSGEISMTTNPFLPPKAVVRDAVTSKEVAAAWLKGVFWRVALTYTISMLPVIILLRWALKDHVSPELSFSVRMVASAWIFALILWSLSVITGRPALSLLPGKSLGLSSTGWKKATNAVLFSWIALGLWQAVAAILIGPGFRKVAFTIGFIPILAAFMVPLYKAMVRSPEQFEADRPETIELPSGQD